MAISVSVMSWMHFICLTCSQYYLIKWIDGAVARKAKKLITWHICKIATRAHNEMKRSWWYWWLKERDLWAGRSVWHSVVLSQLRCEAAWWCLPRLTRPRIDSLSSAPQCFCSLVCACRTGVGVDVYRGKWTGCIACVCVHIYIMQSFLLWDTFLLAKIIRSCSCVIAILSLYIIFPYSPCCLGISCTRINTFTLRRLFAITILLKLQWDKLCGGWDRKYVFLCFKFRLVCLCQLCSAFAL